MEFQRERINWTVGKVMNANLHIVQYQPLQGSIYIPLLAKLANKKAIVNVQNQDHKCFMWLILASLHPKQGQDNNPNRVSNNTSYQGELHFMNIPSPVRVADDPKFEKKTILPSMSSDMKGRTFTRYIWLRKVAFDTCIFLSSPVKRRHITAGSNTSTNYFQINTGI